MLGTMTTGNWNMSFVDKEPKPKSPRPRDARRAVALDVKLRRPGEGWFSSRIVNLSRTGFCIDSFVTLGLGWPIWIMFPGFEGRRATVMWVRGHQAGCRFDVPLYEAVLDHILRQS